jgi:hypothetical protein
MNNLKQYVKTLQLYLELNPDKAELPVIMTQSGYYSEGYIADLYDAPEYNKQKNAIVLGHSHQSY